MTVKKKKAGVRNDIALRPALDPVVTARGARAEPVF